MLKKKDIIEFCTLVAECQVADEINKKKLVDRLYAMIRYNGFTVVRKSFYAMFKL
jgi:hypothetical protein